jgi:hypothetical protein
MVRHEQVWFLRVESVTAVYAHFDPTYPENTFGPEANEAGGTFSVGVKEREEQNRHTPKERQEGDQANTENNKNPQITSLQEKRWRYYSFSFRFSSTWLIFLHFLLQSFLNEGRRVIVECPSCHTRYRTDNISVIDESTLFQCSQEDCGHIFSHFPALLQGARKSLSPTMPAPVLPSELKEEQPGEEGEEQDVLAEDTSQSWVSLPSPPPAKKSTKEATSFVAEDRLEDFSPQTVPFYADPEEEIATEQFIMPETTTRQPSGVMFSLKLLLSFLAALVLFYAAVGFYCFSYPVETKAALVRLPLLGTLFSGEHFSTQHVILTRLEGHYQTTKDNYRVFTISGTATNSATLPARSVQIEGTIYDTTSKVAGRRVIFCGTEIATERLAYLTLREVGTLQNLVPPKQFHIPAGQTIKFLIVFTAPPLPIAEFSSRVVAAQFSGP